MSIITLTTDYGLKDHFVGSLKGKIYSEDLTTIIVDISHQVEHFDVLQAAYLLTSAYKDFPKNTIHIIGVDSELQIDTEHVVMFWEDQYFIAADNGILGLISQNIVPEKMVAINIHDRLHADASDLDIFVTVAMHIRRGGLLNVIGKEISSVKSGISFGTTAAIEPNSIKGSVIYNDNFGNAVTNITKKMFLETGNGRPYEISHGIPDRERRNTILKTILPKYSDISRTRTSDKQMHEGSMVAIFNTAGYLELGIYRSGLLTGDARTLLGLRYSTPVTIHFKDL